MVSGWIRIRMRRPRQVRTIEDIVEKEWNGKARQSSYDLLGSAVPYAIPAKVRDGVVSSPAPVRNGGQAAVAGWRDLVRILVAVDPNAGLATIFF